MIIVIEGGIGVGKTTLAEQLAQHSGWPIWRAFRKPGSHSPGDHDPRIQESGLKVNSWMEDLVAADLLAAVGANVILDRSLPSGLAYDNRDVHQANAALGVWEDCLEAAGGLVLHLKASTWLRLLRSSRTPRGFCTGDREADFHREAETIRKYILRLKKVPVYELVSTRDNIIGLFQEALKVVHAYIVERPQTAIRTPFTV